jgi:hypothetical protein
MQSGSPPRHSAECGCATCERLGLGLFAQLAALAGDQHAADRLSAPVRAFVIGHQAEPAKGARGERLPALWMFEALLIALAVAREHHSGNR